VHQAEQQSDDSEIDIAIIGMAGRFPGAEDVEAFWRNLRDGVESIAFYTDEELLKRGVPAETLADPLYVKAGAHLEGVDPSMRRSLVLLPARRQKPIRSTGSSWRSPGRRWKMQAMTLQLTRNSSASTQVAA
jgi:hypothetical protein